MRVHQIIGSIGLHGNRKVERVECKNSNSNKAKRSKLKDCGYTREQRLHILAIMSEMKDYNTTC